MSNDFMAAPSPQKPGPAGTASPSQLGAATSHVGAAGALVFLCGLVPPEVRQRTREREEYREWAEQERAASKAVRRHHNRALPRARRFRGVREARVGTGPDDVLWRLP